MTQIHCVGSGGMFAAGSLFAGEHGECTRKLKRGEPACTVSLGSLNLTPDQKTKMDAAMEEHHKAGCSEASEAKYRQEAKTILNKEQFRQIQGGVQRRERQSKDGDLIVSAEFV